MKVNFKLLFILGILLLTLLSFLAGIYFKQVMTTQVIIPFTMHENIKIITQLEGTKFNLILKNEETSKLKNNSDITNYFKSLPFIKVNILDHNYDLLFSSNNNGLFYESTPSEHGMFVDAFKGIIKNQKIDNAIYENNDNREKISIIKTLLPIKNNNNEVFLVAETFYDITELTKIIESIEHNLIGGFIGFAFIFIIILFYLTSKSQTIIVKQHEANIELEKAKLKAEAASEEKSKFLTNVSHELRTPLNAIIGFSQIIKDQALGEVSNKQYLEYSSDIYNSGVHLLSLINDILDYSKAEASKLTVDIQDVDLNKIVESSMRMVESRAREAGVNLVTDIPKEHIVIKADPKRLKQVLLNLLSNAVKFTPEGKEVECNAFINHVEHKIYIIVKDTGIGIAAKDISKAMATFGQIDSALSRKFEGTGLGLPLTKKLVELMHGEFYIESEQNVGTTITLKFNL